MTQAPSIPLDQLFNLGQAGGKPKRMSLRREARYRREGRMPGQGGGGGQPGINLAALAQYLDSAQGSANEANQGRLDEAMGLLAGGRDNALGALRGGHMASLDALARVGDSTRDRLARERDENKAGTQASLAARGLLNSTVLDSINARHDENYGYGVNDLDERLAQIETSLHSSLGSGEAGIYSGMAQQKAGLLERVQDEGPDVGQFMPLIAMQMQAQAEAQANAQQFEHWKEQRRIEQNQQRRERLRLFGV